MAAIGWIGCREKHQLGALSLRLFYVTVDAMYTEYNKHIKVRNVYLIYGIF